MSRESTRARAPPVTLDWINDKNVKLLRVANHREAFRFKKLSQALSSMESLHKSCWLREERRVKQNLQRLTRVSPACRSQTLFQRPSEDFRAGPVGGASLVGGANSVGGASRGQLPAGPASRSNHEDTSGPLTPRPRARPSQRGMTLQCDPPPVAPLCSSLSPCWGGRHGAGSGPAPQRLGRYPSTLSLLSQDPAPGAPPVGNTSAPLLPTPSILALLPPHLSPELQGLQEAVLGFPLLQRRVRELISRARAAEQQRQAQRNVTLRPLEALHCRYLRLSESNISTLLGLCKDSGVDVEIHPHMKDSDIDISHVFNSSPLVSSSPSKEML